MKLNKIMMVLAATAIVGCTSDDLNELAPKQAAEDSRLIELDENFVLAGVGAEGTFTRTHWELDKETKALVNKFLPTYTADASGVTLDQIVDVKEQAVGLCWLGQGAVGTDVYTNYQFYHFGWLNNDETEADLDKCGVLYNGSLYTDIKPSAGTAGKEAAPTTDFVGGIPAKSMKAGKDNLNYNSGVYRTDNKSIFGGQYIVYYPFNQDFTETGTIPAIAKTTFNNVSTEFDTPEIGKATFRYSAPVTIEGGYQAADFGLYNLSTLVQLRVATPKGDAFANTKSIDKIILYSPSKKLLKQANLAADKIVAGNKGADLYASTEGTSTIAANFTAPVVLQETTSTSPKPTSAYITVLPTTVDDLLALVHNQTDNTWAVIGLPTTVFEAGKAKRLDIIVASDYFQSQFIAVDQTSLGVALTGARAIATEDNPQTIMVIGDITLTSDYTINNATKDKYITITGDDIIVPENVTLTVDYINMESDVRVLGKSCCSPATKGGTLVVSGGTINNVTMEPTEARVPDDAAYDKLNPEVLFNLHGATVAEGAMFDVQAGNVNVIRPVKYKGNIQIAEGAKVTVDGTGTKAGDLNFMGGTVVNNGTIEVLKDGKFDMTASDGGATGYDGLRMTNNGKFIHNVDAQVGTAVQSMHQNGEYRCKVDQQIKLDNAFKWWTACSVIEMVNTTDEEYNLGTYGDGSTLEIKHNGKYIDFEVNSVSAVTTFTNPAIAPATKGDDKIIKIGNLTVTTGGLDVDYVTGTSATNIGRRTLTVNGDMVVKATTNIVDSKKINVTGDLTVDGTEGTVALNYKGGKTYNVLNNVDGLEVKGDINVKAAAFNAGGSTYPTSDPTDVDALNIKCVNFYLTDKATAVFGNTTDGGAKTMTVSGTISNPKDCVFNIVKANQDGNGSVLANIICKKLEVGGTFSAARPQVEKVTAE